MRALLERRGEGRPRLWDGAIGTELIARGLDLAREPPEAWTLARPDEVRNVHARYIEAGAEVIQTNTFGGSRPRLAPRGLADRLAKVNRDAVALARAAVAEQPGLRSGAGRASPVVVASLGPTGLDPFAPDAAREIEAAYAEQVTALAGAGVAGLHFETMYHPTEALAAVAAARRVAPELPVVISFTVALGDHGFQTPLAVPLARMAGVLDGAAPDGIGLNCSLEARKLLGALGALRNLTDRPILIQPQGGASSVGCKGDVRGDDPDRFARDTLALLDEGADAVGGCCGAGPDHLAALAAAIEARFPRR